MVVRLLRSSKWELILFFIITAGVSLFLFNGLPYWLPDTIKASDQHLISILLILPLNIGAGYWAAQRVHRHIDTLHVALKQAANGNLAVRLPEDQASSFVSAYREFNVMVAAMEERLQLIQQVGEEQVMQGAASVEAAVMEERKRLGRDLHDTVSQQLFAIHMSASSLPKLLELNPDRAGEVMNQLIHMSSMAQKQMRGLIAKLRPLELEGRSLQQALDKWFPDYCRQNGLQGVLEWQLKEQLSEAKEHQFFLIIQEGMANIVKHAEADTATLTITETERQFILNLQDDGAGFRPDQVERGSYGLSTMRERAQRLGGDAEIISKPGGGTKVRVTIPKLARKEESLHEPE
ncbi:sensor histidine kinase [Paenibacillus pinihumi]|uniref:sensor histidine kinase n=1 Tax=Paenibacillus pinihumi TaxID=669462 RepID=UPI0003FD91E5|nr:sensor histidine kinase [Paenibacillus pinihumi]